MIEDNQVVIERLCSILHAIRTKEKELRRAQYRTAYYRGVRSAIQKSQSSTLHEEWRKGPKKLEDKINECRLERLSVQAETVKLKKQLSGKLAEALQEARAHLQFNNGALEGISIASDEKDPSIRWLLPASMIEEYASRWEATVAMNNLLENEEEKEVDANEV